MTSQEINRPQLKNCEWFKMHKEYGCFYWLHNQCCHSIIRTLEWKDDVEGRIEGTAISCCNMK
jgi:hypothetical protein